MILCRFMWYVLKDRSFDEAAVADLVHLKQELALSNEEVTEALLERCKRIEKKFGNLILPPGGEFSALDPLLTTYGHRVDYRVAS